MTREDIIEELGAIEAVLDTRTTVVKVIVDEHLNVIGRVYRGGRVQLNEQNIEGTNDKQ